MEVPSLWGSTVKLFREPLPTKPFVFNTPAPGAKITFDEDERTEIELVGNPEVGLKQAAKHRLEAGAYSAAASSCAKGIALIGGHPSFLLLMAEICVEYGDLAMSEKFAKLGESTAKKANLWKAHRSDSQRIGDLIQLKLAGLTGHEESVTFLNGAESLSDKGNFNPQLARSYLAWAEEAAQKEGSLANLERSGIIQRIRKQVNKHS